MSKTLRELRLEAGMTLNEVAEKIKTLRLQGPTTHVGVLHLEKRGSQNVTTLSSLARVFSVPFDTVVAAAQNTRDKKSTELAQNP